MLRKSFKSPKVSFLIASTHIRIYVGRVLFFEQPLIKSSFIPQHISPLVYWYAYSYFLALRFGLVLSLKKYKL